MKIIVDQQQVRLNQDRVHVVATSQEMDDGYYTSTVREPVNGYSLLQPSRLEANWYGLSTGNYTKTALSGFGISTGLWESTSIPSVAAGPWIGLMQTSMAGGELYTSTSYSKNRGFSISFFNYGSQENTAYNPCLSFGWGTSKTTSSFYVSVFPDGKCDIYRSGVLYQSGSISAYSDKNQKGKNTHSFYDLIVMPYNHNQLLVWSLNGGSFVVECEDILQSDTSPTITPSGNFFINVPSGRPAKFQLAPLLFNSPGTVWSEKMNFITPPVTGSVLESWDNVSWIGVNTYRIYGYPSYVGIQTASLVPVDWSGSAFAPNSSNTQVRAKFTLSTNDTGYSPTLVGGQVAYAGSYQFTPSSETEITQYSNHLELDVPEDPAGVHVRFDVIDIGIARTYVPNLDTQINRPIKILDSNNVIVFDGVISNLRLKLEQGVERLEVEARDKWAIAEQYLVRERVPLANERFESVVGYFAGKFTNSSFITTPSPTLRLPFVSHSDAESWGPIANIGDTAASKLRDTFENFGADWIYGFRPGNMFYAQPKSGYTTTFIGLASSRTEAVALGYATNLATSDAFVYYNLRTETLQPEANEIRVTGYNPRLDTVFHFWKEDTQSKDATLAVGSRPSNWVGHTKVYGIIDPAYTDIGIASYACGILYNRLTRSRKLYELEAKYLTNNNIPIWRGDIITLAGIGTARVTALRVHWMKHNKARVAYTLEKET